MIRRRTINSVLFPLLVLIAASCSKGPTVDHYEFLFRDTERPVPTGSYAFKFSIDSGRVYKTFIACRIDRRIIQDDKIGLDLLLVSPSGNKYGEKISLPIIECEGIRISNIDRMTVDIEWPYREGVESRENPGLWNVIITVADRSKAEGVLGLGFSYIIDNG